MGGKSLDARVCVWRGRETKTETKRGSYRRQKDDEGQRDGEEACSCLEEDVSHVGALGAVAEHALARFQSPSLSLCVSPAPAGRWDF